VSLGDVGRHRGGCLSLPARFTDETLVKAGTEKDVDSRGGRRRPYSAWYELVPLPLDRLCPIGSHPGKRITVSISQTLPEVALGHSPFKNTRQSELSTTTPYPSTMGSAEWVAETQLAVGNGRHRASPAMPNRAR